MSAADYMDVILPLNRAGKPVAFIHREVQQKNSSVSAHAIRKFLQVFHSSKPITITTPHTPRRLAANIEVIKNEILKSFREDSSATADEISRRLRARKISVSTMLIKFWRDRLGFKRNTTKYCHIIRDENKKKRVDFCNEMIAKGEKFYDCIFTDESTFQHSTKYCYVEEGNETARMRSRAKHPAKLHVWRGISTRGTIDFAIFNGAVRMDSKLYCDILEECYLGISRKAFIGFGRLIQDNAPTHKSVFTTRRLQQWGVRTVAWPAESPDLNSIELVWGNMKNYIRRQSLKTIGDLEHAIRSYWERLTPEVCQRYIEGIQWRMPLVVSAKGGNIKEKRPKATLEKANDIEEDSSDSGEDDDWF